MKLVPVDPWVLCYPHCCLSTTKCHPALTFSDNFPFLFSFFFSVFSRAFLFFFLLVFLGPQRVHTKRKILSNTFSFFFVFCFCFSLEIVVAFLIVFISGSTLQHNPPNRSVKWTSTVTKWRPLLSHTPKKKHQKFLPSFSHTRSSPEKKTILSLLSWVTKKKNSFSSPLHTKSIWGISKEKSKWISKQNISPRHKRKIWCKKKHKEFAIVFLRWRFLLDVSVTN